MTFDEMVSKISSLTGETPEVVRQQYSQFSECTNLKLSGKLTLKKFDGEYEEGKLPVEEIVREGDL